MRALLTRPGLATTGRSQIPGVLGCSERGPQGCSMGPEPFPTSSFQGHDGQPVSLLTILVKTFLTGTPSSCLSEATLFYPQPPGL